MFLLGWGLQQYLWSIYKCINTMIPDTGLILIPGYLGWQFGAALVLSVCWITPAEYKIILFIISESPRLHKGRRLLKHVIGCNPLRQNDPFLYMRRTLFSSIDPVIQSRTVNLKKKQPYKRAHEKKISLHICMCKNMSL